VVTSFPGAVGRPGQSLLHDTFDANLQLTQSLFDPSRGAREGVERAQLARNRADVLTALYSNRQQVNASFFQVAELSARHEAMLATITDLEAQARVAEARVRNGAALPSEVSTVRAELPAPPSGRRADPRRPGGGDARAVRPHRRRVPP
jgi:outer membrane protein TolC